MIPIQWHVYIVDLEPRVGTKPGKQRPVVAIQPSEFAEAGLDSTVIVPITTKLSGIDAWPMRVMVPAGVCGLTRDSEVMIDQIIAWDHTAFKKDLGSLPNPLIDLVKKAVKEFLDL